MGPSDSGKVGNVVEDDSSELPFKVECNGNDSWYTQDELVLAATVEKEGQCVQMTIQSSVAFWTGCPGLRLEFYPGFQLTVREIRKGFFNSTSYQNLWAPLSAAGAIGSVAAASNDAIVVASLGGRSAIPIGQRVVRGPNWNWGDQDGGAGNTGLCTALSTSGWTTVEWDRGASNVYKNGIDKCFDLAPVHVSTYIDYLP